MQSIVSPARRRDAAFIERSCSLQVRFKRKPCNTKVSLRLQRHLPNPAYLELNMKTPQLLATAALLASMAPLASATTAAPAAAAPAAAAATVVNLAITEARGAGGPAAWCQALVDISRPPVPRAASLRPRPWPNA
jgi:hypothetical protein